MVHGTNLSADNVFAMSEREPLPEEVQVGGREHLGSLLEEFRPYLLTIAAEELPRHLGRKLGASDLVQEAVVKGYQSFATFHGTTREELACWLRKILLNHLNNVVDAFHTEKRDVDLERRADIRVVQAGKPSPSGVLLSQEQRESLEGALSRLPEELRRVVLLRHRENLSFAELARVLSRSETGARKLWARAVRALRQELREQESNSS